MLGFSLKTGVTSLAEPLWQLSGEEVSQVVVGGEGSFKKYKVAI